MHKQEPAYAQAEARTLTGCYPNEHEEIRLRNITSDGVQFPLVQDFGIEVSRPNKKEVKKKNLCTIALSCLLAPPPIFFTL